MKNVLVIQSHTTPLPYPWIESCLASVRQWCEQHQYEYRFIGDELFECVTQDILNKTQQQKVVATDLARLVLLQKALNEDYDTVIWLDADFLIFHPCRFELPDVPYAAGREVWVQYDKQHKLRTYTKVHNAFLLFHKDNSVLDFYRDSAQRLLELNRGTMPPQFIGPKLLTALHNVTALPVLETAGMLSPLVIKDILTGEGAALALFNQQSPEQLYAANLCSSSCERNDISNAEMQAVIDILVKEKRIP